MSRTILPFWQKRQTNGRLKGTLAGYPAVSPASHAASLLPSELSPGPKPAPPVLCFVAGTGQRRPFPRSVCAVPTSTPKPPAGHRRRSAACGGCHSMRMIAFAIFLELAMPTPSQLVGGWQGDPAAADRAGHRKRACEASSSPSLHFRYVMGESPSLSLLYSGLSHPASSVPNRPIPSRAQNAPGFALFGLFRVGFAFCPLSAPKSSGMILWLGWRPLSLSSTKKAGIVPGLFPTDSSHAVLPV